MIASKDRSYYIGASDTAYVIGNWDTISFQRWFGVKLGIYTINYESDAMKAGTAYEHRILDSLGIPDMKKDRQIITGRLRVNLDGNTDTTIYEVKTYRHDNGFKMPKKYLEQVWVQMYGTGLRDAYIVAYGLVEADYNNFYRDIDIERLDMFRVEYNEDFINEAYIPRFRYLSSCLERGVFPRKEAV